MKGFIMTVGSTSFAQMQMIQMQQGSNPQKQSQNLTESQLEIISSVLSNYDSENLTQSEATQIVEAFQAAGIRPGSSLESAMAAEGFSAKEVGELAGVGSKGAERMPPPPPKNEELENSVSALLDTLFNTEDEEENSSNVSFDDVMEYTARILNLNEKSQSEAINILNEYATQTDDYSQEDLETIIKGSLSGILSDNNNYRHTSFYA